MNSFPGEISFVLVQLRSDAGICLLIPVICFPRSGKNEPIPFPRNDLSGAALTATMKQMRVLFKKSIHPFSRLRCSSLTPLSLLSSHRRPIPIHAYYCHRSPTKRQKDKKERKRKEEERR
jgi:hypothetical protein